MYNAVNCRSDGDCCRFQIRWQSWLWVWLLLNISGIWCSRSVRVIGKFWKKEASRRWTSHAQLVHTVLVFIKELIGQGWPKWPWVGFWPNPSLISQNDHGSYTRWLSNSLVYNNVWMMHIVYILLIHLPRYIHNNEFLVCINLLCKKYVIPQLYYIIINYSNTWIILMTVATCNAYVNISYYSTSGGI